MNAVASTLRKRLSSFLYRYGWDTQCRNRCPAKIIRSALNQNRTGVAPALLDVGCGRLGVAMFLRNTRVVGADLLPPTEAMRHFAFVSSSATALPFRNRAFSAVSCVDVLEHLPPEVRGEAIRECVRVAAEMVLMAFPSGPAAQRCDREYHQACTQRGREIPTWVDEHLRYQYPVAETVATQIQAAAEASGYSAHIQQSYCEPLSIARVVRATAARSTALYAIVNVVLGFLSRLIPQPHAAEGYRTIVVAELSLRRAT